MSFFFITGFLSLSSLGSDADVVDVLPNKGQVLMNILLLRGVPWIGFLLVSPYFIEISIFKS